MCICTKKETAALDNLPICRIFLNSPKCMSQLNKILQNIFSDMTSKVGFLCMTCQLLELIRETISTQHFFFSSFFLWDITKNVVGCRDPGPKINIFLKVTQSSQKFPDNDHVIHNSKDIYFKRGLKMLSTRLSWDNRQVRIVLVPITLVQYKHSTNHVSIFTF